jgi:hypothetical protein
MAQCRRGNIIVASTQVLSARSKKSKIAPSHEAGNNAGIDKANPGTAFGMKILSRRKSASVIFLHHIHLTARNP